MFLARKIAMAKWCSRNGLESDEISADGRRREGAPFSSFWSPSSPGWPGAVGFDELVARIESDEGGRVGLAQAVSDLEQARGRK